MKLNKKSLIALLLLAILVISPMSAYALPSSPTPICITSGVELGTEGTESTFSDNRTIYGEANAGAKIILSVSKMDAEGNYVEEYREEFEVGSLGMFCATIPLELGRNYITISASEDGYEDVCSEAIIKRLSESVRQELKNMIALPITIDGIR